MLDKLAVYTTQSVIKLPLGCFLVGEINYNINPPNN
jgi:hypothetical protein